MLERDLVIRPAVAADAEAIRGLCLQLGYEQEIEAVKAALCERSTREVLVAELGGAVVGWIELESARHLTGGPECLICGLVVDEALRGQKIGERLTLAAEDWARVQGLPVVRVRSRLSRERAHQFYLRLGYEEYKRQVVFVKRLDGDLEDGSRKQ